MDKRARRDRNFASADWMALTTVQHMDRTRFDPIRLDPVGVLTIGTRPEESKLFELTGISALVELFTEHTTDKLKELY